MVKRNSKVPDADKFLICDVCKKPGGTLVKIDKGLYVHSGCQPRG